MEFRTGWKGILILTIIIILTCGGFPKFYPTIKESSVEELKGAEYLNIEISENSNVINLSWDNVPGAVMYKVLEDNTTTVKNKLSNSLRNFSTTETNLSVPYDFEEKRYYGVYFLIENSTEPILMYGSGIFAQTNMVALGLSTGQPIRFRPSMSASRLLR